LLFGTPERQPRLDLGAPGVRGSQCQRIAVPGGGLLFQRDFLGCRQAGGDGSERLLLCGNVFLGFGQRCCEAVAFPDRAAKNGVQVAQAFCHGGQPGIRVMQPVQCGVGALLRPGALGLSAGQGEPVPLQARGDPGKLALGVVHCGLHLQEGRRLRRAAGG
jgi:hypothetical protein